MSGLPERLTTFANWLPAGQADAKKLLAEAASHIAELEAERQLVLDAVNLFGDEILHSHLDVLGWVPRKSAVSP